ncbi:MAG TPA: hypothetical protein VFV70_14815, partial [Hyphomonadaceae bacterium]|nr:hypothetical protein [Hyphomonadaceae bacterium]
MTPQQINQAVKSLKQFETSPKGPYFQIRWFCKDGTEFPPAGVPCRPHGGGVQHATLTEQAKQLSAWGMDVGTILTALPYDDALDAARDN